MRRSSNSRALSSIVSPSIARPPGAQVEGDAADPQLRLLARGALAAQPGPDPRDQLLEVKRLRQVVVGAGLEALDPVVRVAARGEHDHRQPLARGAQVAEHVEPVLAGQPEVEDQQVEVLVVGERVDARPVADDRGREAARAQPLLQERRQARLVLGDQDPAHGERARREARS